MILTIAAANAGTQSFNAGGAGGGLGASSANAGGKLYIVIVTRPK